MDQQVAWIVYHRIIYADSLGIQYVESCVDEGNMGFAKLVGNIGCHLASYLGLIFGYVTIFTREGSPFHMGGLPWILAPLGGITRKKIKISVVHLEGYLLRLCTKVTFKTERSWSHNLLAFPNRKVGICSTGKFYILYLDSGRLLFTELQPIKYCSQENIKLRTRLSTSQSWFDSWLCYSLPTCVSKLFRRVRALSLGLKSFDWGTQRKDRKYHNFSQENVKMLFSRKY